MIIDKMNLNPLKQNTMMKETQKDKPNRTSGN